MGQMQTGAPLKDQVARFPSTRGHQGVKGCDVQCLPQAKCLRGRELPFCHACLHPSFY